MLVGVTKRRYLFYRLKNSMLMHIDDFFCNWIIVQCMFKETLKKEESFGFWFKNIKFSLQKLKL